MAAIAAAVGSGLLMVSCRASEPTWEDLVDGLDGDLNVVLVTIDTLRADFLSSYGSTRASTPHLDRLAREGTLFSNAATTVPFTLPAHSSIMTGTYPPYHGVRENVGYYLGDENRTLAQMLSEAGWQAAGFVSAFVLDARWGIGRGFDLYLDDFDVASMEQINLGSVQREGSETVAEAVQWLDGRPEGPFFLWVHLFDPHDPYTPPEPYKSQYPQDPYAGEVAYTDSLIGELRAALEERGLLDTSLVIVTGDHGEGLGEHSENYHGYFVYDSTTLIPLIVRSPFPELAGRVVDSAVSHVDIQPTILAATRAPPSESAQGESLLPLLLGAPANDDRIVYTESYYPLFHYGWAPLRSVRSARYKFIDAPQPELFDLAVERPEQENVVRRDREVSRDLKERLDAMLATLDRPEGTETSQPDLDEETLRQLRALGYVAGRGEVAAEDEGDAPRADPKEKIVVHQSIMMAQSFIGQEQFEKAERRLTQALELDPGMIDAHQMLGHVAVRQKQHEKALGHFQRALALDGDHKTSLFGLANSYRQLGRIEEALVGFERLRSLNPSDSKAVVAIVEMRGALGQRTEALAILEEATARDDPPAILFNQLGEFLVLEGRGDEAIASFQRAIEGNERLSQPRFNLAVVWEGRGQSDRAIGLYEQTLQLAPENYQAQFNLGRLYGARGDLDRQQALYESSIESNPDFVRGYYFLAKLLMDRGADMERAEELARTGIDKDPDHRIGPLGYFVLADILNRSGRPAEARAAVQAARRIQDS